MNLKKILIISLITVMSFAVFTPISQASSFPDVPEDFWAYESIKEAYERGIIKGYPNGNFGPNDPLTFEQFMTMLGNMISNYELIEDKVTGCNAYIFNTKEIAKVSKGDVDQSVKFRRDFYRENKIDDLLTQKSDYIEKYNLELNKENTKYIGTCPKLGWDRFDVSPNNVTHFPIKAYLSDRIQKHGIDNLIEVVHLSSIVSQYFFMHNNGRYVKDYSLNLDHIDNIYLYQNYFKTNDETYDDLYFRYLTVGATTNKITREDMAIILYIFLDYENKKLLSSYQDSWIFPTHIKQLQEDLKFRDFKSQYSDIPTQFIEDEEVIDKPFRYQFGIVHVKTYTDLTVEEVKSNHYLGPYTSLPMTSRGAILAVSDTTFGNGQHLLTGSNGKFRPKDNLTRAQGVTVALRLEQYLKEHFNLIERSEGTLLKKSTK